MHFISYDLFKFFLLHLHNIWYILLSLSYYKANILSCYYWKKLTRIFHDTSFPLSFTILFYIWKKKDKQTFIVLNLLHLSNVHFKDKSKFSLVSKNLQASKNVFPPQKIEIQSEVLFDTTRIGRKRE